MLLASGGVWVGLLSNSQTLLLPTYHDAVERALKKLKIDPVMVLANGVAAADVLPRVRKTGY